MWAGKASCSFPRHSVFKQVKIVLPFFDTTYRAVACYSDGGFSLINNSKHLISMSQGKLSSGVPVWSQTIWPGCVLNPVVQAMASSYKNSVLTLRHPSPSAASPPWLHFYFSSLSGSWSGGKTNRILESSTEWSAKTIASFRSLMGERWLPALFINESTHLGAVGNKPPSKALPSIIRSRGSGCSLCSWGFDVSIHFGKTSRR